MRILIANRGEIARRVIRTAHRLGHETVAVFADPDATAPHTAEATTAVRIGPASLADSYLSVERILDAAASTGAEAVHPGYGFLSENTEFATACINRGLIWIGPKPEIIASMGSKIEARAIAEAAGIPTIPGWSESQDPDELASAAADIGYPILVKASAGGGGKGIRIANSADEFPAALAEASTEAERAFGDGSVIVERYVQRPRHIEVQIVGDRHGNVVDLGTRECSVQRRYQKLLEEAPAPNLTDATRHGLRDSARRLGSSMGYDSAGTVEFVVDDDTGEHFFLEVKTRLQVEHPVTEAVTGLDLVELMIRVAAGETLPIDGDTPFEGHAIEARIVAEDPAMAFAPQIGPIHQLRVPAGVRWDAAIEAGSEVTPHYDSMIAKLIVHGVDRADAIARMSTALDELVIDGPVTTAGFHRWLLDQQPIIDGRVTTRFLDETELPMVSPSTTPNVDAADDPADDPADRAAIHESASVAWLRAIDQRTPTTSPWFGSTFSVTPEPRSRRTLLADRHGIVETLVTDPDVEASLPTTVDLDARRVAVNHAGHTYGFAVPSRSEAWAPGAATREGSGDAIAAPFPAVVSEVTVTPGDTVEGDQVLVVIEAMKMLHSLRASGRAVVAEVRVAPGDQIAGGDVLITFESPDPD